MLPNIQAYRIRVAMHLVVTGIHNRTQGEQSDCMTSDYDSMRLVHRRNNPNKETLIYIFLSHATEYPSV